MCFKKTSADVQKNLPTCAHQGSKLPDKGLVEEEYVISFAETTPCQHLKNADHYTYITRRHCAIRTMIDAALVR